MIQDLIGSDVQTTLAGEKKTKTFVRKLEVNFRVEISPQLCQVKTGGSQYLAFLWNSC